MEPDHEAEYLVLGGFADGLGDGLPRWVPEGELLQETQPFGRRSKMSSYLGTMLAQPTIFRNLNQNTLDLRANRNSSKYFRFKVKEQFSAVSVHAVNTTEKKRYMLLFLRSQSVTVRRHRSWGGQS